MMLYQRGHDGHCVPGDEVTHKAYGPIPDAKYFQNEKGGKEIPRIIRGWQWSIAFKRWGAVVIFNSGWHGYTWPIIETQDEEES